MQELTAGDRLAPVTATHVASVPQISGVVFRMDFVTRPDQALDTAETTQNFIMKSAQARALAQNLIDAANAVDNAQAAAQATQAAKPQR